MSQTRPAALGTPSVVELGSARLQVFEAGPADGPVVVFVQGLLVNADVWLDVVPALAEAGMRCITVDWPLGSHAIPVPEADLTPPGVADLVADFLQVQDLRNVTVVANDTGGAITQILMTRNPDRVGRVVLTPSDSFECFFPPMFTPLTYAARIPGMVWFIGQGMRFRVFQRLPMAYGWLSKKRLPAEMADSFLTPMLGSRAIRRDLARFLRGVHKRHTLAAAEELPAFDKPVLLAWASEDRFFATSLAERLADVLPQARIELLEDCATLVPVDQPQKLVELVTEFVVPHHQVVDAGA